MGKRRVGIANGPDRGLTVRSTKGTVRPPLRDEGQRPETGLGRATGRRGTLADAALVWARLRDGDAATRCAVIEQYVPLASRIAHGMNVPVGAVASADDLESAAVIGLIDAVDRFDPQRGVPFEGYASLRIRGAVLDEVRRVDELGRADRRRQRALVATGGEPRGVATVSLDELLDRGFAGGAVNDDVS